MTIPYDEANSYPNEKQALEKITEEVSLGHPLLGNSKRFRDATAEVFFIDPDLNAEDKKVLIEALKNTPNTEELSEVPQNSEVDRVAKELLIEAARVAAIKAALTITAQIDNLDRRKDSEYYGDLANQVAEFQEKTTEFIKNEENIKLVKSFSRLVLEEIKILESHAGVQNEKAITKYCSIGTGLAARVMSKKLTDEMGLLSNIGDQLALPGDVEMEKAFRKLENGSGKSYLELFKKSYEVYLDASFNKGITPISKFTARIAKEIARGNMPLTYEKETVEAIKHKNNLRLFDPQDIAQYKGYANIKPGLEYEAPTHFDRDLSTTLGVIGKEMIKRNIHQKFGLVNIPKKQTEVYLNSHGEQTTVWKDFEQAVDTEYERHEIIFDLFPFIASNINEQLNKTNPSREEELISDQEDINTLLEKQRILKDEKRMQGLGEITKEEALRIAAVVVGRRAAMDVIPNYEYIYNLPINQIPTEGQDEELAEFADAIKNLDNALTKFRQGKTPQLSDTEAAILCNAFGEAIFNLRKCEMVGIDSYPKLGLVKK